MIGTATQDVGRRGAPHRVAAARIVIVALVAALALARPVAGHEAERFEARTGIDLAYAGAQSWAQDAVLVYVENDEPLDAQGAAERWGYLFYSPTSKKARAYSIRAGKILVAENLEIKIEPPPVTDGWIDSGAALAVAEKDAGRAFRHAHGGWLSTMLLMRIAFQDSDPDETTWTFVYEATDGPSLFVVVDASQGKVRRTWRG